MPFVRKAANDKCLDNWQLSRHPVPLGPVSVWDLPRAWQTVQRWFSDRTRLNLYHLEVTASDPVTAANSANLAVVIAQEQARKILGDAEDRELRALLANLASEAEKAHREGDEERAKGFELAIFWEMHPGCRMGPDPVKIWEKAEPNDQRSSTFARLGTQASLLLSATVLAGFCRRKRAGDNGEPATLRHD
jgi:hypothetical protein